MKSKSRFYGFTIIELLVVITIIAIISGITVLTYDKTQKSSRDSQRSSRITVISSYLERYYEKNGEYPSCKQMTQPADQVSKSVLQGIEPQALLTPSNTNSSSTSFICTTMTAGNGPDTFSYIGDGSANCDTGTACLQYTLQYRAEATGTIVSVKGQHQTQIATSGTPVVVANPTGFTQINLTWNSIDNAISYRVMSATDSNFTANVTDQNVSGTSLSLSTLTYNTTYYFRVAANASTGQGKWSDVVSASTWTLASPTISVTVNSSTAFTSSWGSVDHAAGYTAQCSFDNATWTGCSYVTSGTSYAFTGMNQGRKYYTRTQAYSGTYTSNWSNVVAVTTPIDNPPAYAVNQDNTLAGGWNVLYAASNAVCPAGTTPSYDWYYSSNGSGLIFWYSGTQYRSVNYSLSWGETVSLHVASRCITNDASSGFVWANNSANMSLPNPVANAEVPAYRTAGWSGTCPNYTTSNNFYWRVSGNFYAEGNTPSPGQYSNQGVAWGNGSVRVTLTCNGPWGSRTADGWTAFGPGCVPTITVSACYN